MSNGDSETNMFKDLQRIPYSFNIYLTDSLRQTSLHDIQDKLKVKLGFPISVTTSQQSGGPSSL